MAANLTPVPHQTWVPWALGISMALLIGFAVVQGASENSLAVAAPSQYSSSPPSQFLASPLAVAGIALGVLAIIGLLLFLLVFRRRGGGSASATPEATDDAGPAAPSSDSEEFEAHEEKPVPSEETLAAPAAAASTAPAPAEWDEEPSIDDVMKELDSLEESVGNAPGGASPK